MESNLEELPKPSDSKSETFKKPFLVGKIGKLPKKFNPIKPTPTEEAPPTSVQSETEESEPPPPNVTERKSIPYEIPDWSNVPTPQSHDYVLEVLKNGSIIETINLMNKPYWIFGRLPNCHINMQHPTISRYHAVLQYRLDEKDADKTGFYIYDLESTHGTFLNKMRIRPRSFIRVRVGHMLKLGCSTRSFILNGPEEDSEEESALTVTELKKKRDDEIRERHEKQEERKRREEERGIDWGMGEDADEEEDLGENPFAQTNNEELYLDNPKKALRGFFEREGLELEYECTEQGMGQFLCKVELPVDDEMGRPVFAEVFHKGKKKEAVVQCALEACRILDRHGLLRQATHESKKPKPKNWEENDYYDSDEDTFLDRTGTVEKKREMRMHAKAPQKAETYESLLEKEKAMNETIKKLERDLVEAMKELNEDKLSTNDNSDSLDAYMKELKEGKKPTKKGINKVKLELEKLKQDHSNIIKLVNLTKPASLPPLVPQYQNLDMDEITKEKVEKKTLPIFGKRKKIKLELPSKSSDAIMKNISGDEEDEEENETKIDKSEKEEIVKEAENVESGERRRKRNQKRIQQKIEKEEKKKQQGYDEDASKEDYNMWVPPSGQSGDGRTALNDKYGY